MTALLELHQVVSGYGEVSVLHGVSLTVAAGSITALVGSNGAGKTTLMRVISGLLPLASGRIAFDGQDIGAAATHRRIGLGLALVPEGRLIFPDFTVEENLKVGAIDATDAESQTRAWKRNHGQAPLDLGGAALAAAKAPQTRKPGVCQSG